MSDDLQLRSEIDSLLTEVKTAQEAIKPLLASLKSSGEFLDKVGNAGPMLERFFNDLRSYDRQIREGRENVEEARLEMEQARLDPMKLELEKLGEGVDKLREHLATATTGVGELEAARRLPLGYRAAAWLGSFMISAVGLALLFTVLTVYRQSSVIGFDREKSKAEEIGLKLKEVADQIRETQAVVDQIKKTAAAFETFKPAQDGLISRASDLAKELEADRAKIGTLRQELADGISANKTLLNGMTDSISGAVSGIVQTAVTSPIESNKVAVDALSNQLSGLRAILKKPATPERTAVVLFNSTEFKSESCKGALERLFLDTPLRWGYDDYQVALWIVANGLLQTGGKVIPFGSDPAPLKVFNIPWTTEAGSADDFRKFDPTTILPKVDEGMARRLVLIVSASSSPPPIDDSRWPKTVKVHAIVAGKSDKDRFKLWTDFCKSHAAGTAREVAVDTDKLYADLIETTEPMPANH